MRCMAPLHGALSWLRREGSSDRSSLSVPARPGVLVARSGGRIRITRSGGGLAADDRARRPRRFGRELLPSNLVPWLDAAGIHYVRTERPHPAFAEIEENLGYRSFSAAYGNIYTARQLRQLIQRAMGVFTPVEDRWHVGPHVVDPSGRVFVFRPAPIVSSTS